MYKSRVIFGLIVFSCRLGLDWGVYTLLDPL